MDPSWGEILRRISHITPYLWPSKSRFLQFLAMLCVGLVAVGRVINFLVPLAFAQIVRIFEEGTKVSPWPYLFGYVGLRFLQSSGGLAAVRDVSRSVQPLLLDAHLSIVDSVGTSDAIF